MEKFQYLPLPKFHIKSKKTKSVNIFIKNYELEFGQYVIFYHISRDFFFRKNLIAIALKCQFTFESHFTIY